MARKKKYPKAPKKPKKKTLASLESYKKRHAEWKVKCKAVDSYNKKLEDDKKKLAKMKEEVRNM